MAAAAVVPPNVPFVEQVKPNQKIVFDVQSGNVLVTSHTGSKLEFTWHLLSGKAKDVTVKASSSPEAEIITARTRDDGAGHQASIEIDATVPDAARLEVGTSGGSIDVATHAGPMLTRASGGNVTVDTAGGPTDATVSGGNLGIGRAAAGLTASVSGGSARVGSVSGPVTIQASGGPISVGDDDTAPRVSLSSSGGNVTLAAGRRASFRLHAEASGGLVRIAPAFLGGTIVPTGSFDGSIHGGRGSVQLTASGGSVDLVPKQQGDDAEGAR